MLAGCATPQAKTGFGGRTDADLGAATKALLALNANDTATAIDFAEKAVAKNPDDAGFRALLGNAYFKAGRFASAEAAYKDALTLYSNQPQVILKLALVETALGKNDQAVAFLQAGRDVLDASNYGLALTLAGHASDAIPVLEAAAREQGADATVRQNLALAHALAGDWTEARTIAAQDVPANQLDSRIHQWMQLASPKKASDQVAALTGVTPAASDQGQPVRLALRRTDTMMAQAAPAPKARKYVAVSARGGLRSSDRGRAAAQQRPLQMRGRSSPRSLSRRRLRSSSTMSPFRLRSSTRSRPSRSRRSLRSRRRTRSLPRLRCRCRSRCWPPPRARCRPSSRRSCPRSPPLPFTTPRHVRWFARGSAPATRSFSWVPTGRRSRSTSRGTS